MKEPADDLHRIASYYSRFALEEVGDRSPLYFELANGVARDPEFLARLAVLPVAKQQPNLLLAAVKYLFGTTKDWKHFYALTHEHWNEIVKVIADKQTQTNEPARCAAFLPLLAQLPQPLALIEVGAAAGLCLLPDRYAYDYDGRAVAASNPLTTDPPVFSCMANASTPVPTRNISVAWRVGLDLHPIDVNDAEAVRWLEALVWPGQGTRQKNLRAALDVARADPPRVVSGDLRFDLPAILAQVPRDATVVVFHTAVLAYLPAEDRIAFARLMKELDIIWLCNESPNVIFGNSDLLREPPAKGSMLLSMNEKPVAWTDGHGASIRWLN